MPTYIVLLRAVNVGGTGKLPMADFRQLLTGLGYLNVETYIQSGNAVFDAPGPAAAVSRAVSAGLVKLTGAPLGIIIRTHEELADTIAANPFAREAAADGARVHVGFLSGPPAKDAASGLDRIVEQYPNRRDRWYLSRDALYLHLPDGAADTKFTSKALERILVTTTTARNWNTVLKLHAMSAR